MHSSCISLSSGPVPPASLFSSTYTTYLSLWFQFLIVHVPSCNHCLPSIFLSVSALILSYLTSTTLVFTSHYPSCFSHFLPLFSLPFLNFLYCSSLSLFVSFSICQSALEQICWRCLSACCSCMKSTFSRHLFTLPKSVMQPAMQWLPALFNNTFI